MPAAIDKIPQANSNKNIKDLESHKTAMSITELNSKIHKLKNTRKQLIIQSMEENEEKQSKINCKIL